MVPKPTSEVQKTGEAVTEGPGAVGFAGLQRRHDAEHLPRSRQGLPAVPASHRHQPLSAGQCEILTKPRELFSIV